MHYYANYPLCLLQLTTTQNRVWLVEWKFDPAKLHSCLGNLTQFSFPDCFSTLVFLSIDSLREDVFCSDPLILAWYLHMLQRFQHIWMHVFPSVCKFRRWFPMSCASLLPINALYGIWLEDELVSNFLNILQTSNWECISTPPLQNNDFKFGYPRNLVRMKGLTLLFLTCLQHKWISDNSVCVTTTKHFS